MSRLMSVCRLFLCPGYVCVQVISVSRCLCLGYVIVHFMSRLCLCPGFVCFQVLSLSRFCLCPGFVCVQAMSVPRLCLCQGYVCVQFLSNLTSSYQDCVLSSSGYCLGCVRLSVLLCLSSERPSGMSNTGMGQRGEGGKGRQAKMLVGGGTPDDGVSRPSP